MSSMTHNSKLKEIHNFHELVLFTYLVNAKIISNNNNNNIDNNKARV